MSNNKHARRNAESAIDYISGIRNIENRIHVKSEDDRSTRSEASANKSKMKSEAKDSTAKSRNGKTTA